MNIEYQEKVKRFLSEKEVAIAGVSRKPVGEVGNPIMKKFIEEGYTVYPLNPSGEVIDSVQSYKNLSALPQKVEAVFIATNPKKSIEVVNDCVANGVKIIWFHKSFGNGSYNKEAADLAEKNGITVIHSGCPMMFISNADIAHRCFKHVVSFLGKLK
jgi:predicted CoA-binding protein